jgi:hypothetical protein
MSDRAESNMIGALYTKYKSALVVQELEKTVAALAQSARQIADKLDADVQQQTSGLLFCLCMFLLDLV